jgi:hypothetical protein
MPPASHAPKPTVEMTGPFDPNCLVSTSTSVFM